METQFLRCFSSFFFLILGELCSGLVLVSSPVAMSAYKQHRYRNKCIATGSIYAWALSVGGVSPNQRYIVIHHEKLENLDRCFVVYSSSIDHFVHQMPLLMFSTLHHFRNQRKIAGSKMYLYT